MYFFWRLLCAMDGVWDLMDGWIRYTTAYRRSFSRERIMLVGFVSIIRPEFPKHDVIPVARGGALFHGDT